MLRERDRAGHLLAHLRRHHLHHGRVHRFHLRERARVLRFHLLGEISEHHAVANSAPFLGRKALRLHERGEARMFGGVARFQRCDGIRIGFELFAELRLRLDFERVELAFGVELLAERLHAVERCNEARRSFGRQRRSLSGDSGPCNDGYSGGESGDSSHHQSVLPVNPAHPARAESQRGGNTIEERGPPRPGAWGRPFVAARKSIRA